jgi:hypothetical protein
MLPVAAPADWLLSSIWPRVHLVPIAFCTCPPPGGGLDLQSISA